MANHPRNKPEKRRAAEKSYVISGGDPSRLRRVEELASQILGTIFCRDIFKKIPTVCMSKAKALRLFDMYCPSGYFTLRDIYSCPELSIEDQKWVASHVIDELDAGHELFDLLYSSETRAPTFGAIPSDIIYFSMYMGFEIEDVDDVASFIQGLITPKS